MHFTFAAILKSLKLENTRILTTKKAGTMIYVKLLDMGRRYNYLLILSSILLKQPFKYLGQLQLYTQLHLCLYNAQLSILHYCATVNRNFAANFKLLNGATCFVLNWPILYLPQHRAIEINNANDRC